MAHNPIIRSLARGKVRMYEYLNTVVVPAAGTAVVGRRRKNSNRGPVGPVYPSPAKVEASPNCWRRVDVEAPNWVPFYNAVMGAHVVGKNYFIAKDRFIKSALNVVSIHAAREYNAGRFPFGLVPETCTLHE